MTGSRNAVLQRQRDEHVRKLQDYRNNPHAHDNKGHLQNAPNPQQVFDTRVHRLQGQINNFQSQINAINWQLMNLP